MKLKVITRVDMRNGTRHMFRYRSGCPPVLNVRRDYDRGYRQRYAIPLDIGVFSCNDHHPRKPHRKD